MCKSHSCVIGEGVTFNSGLTLAHEIGHSLSMEHDGDGNSCDSSKYIMAEDIGKGQTTWSRCSGLYLKRFLRSSQSNCLYKNISMVKYDLMFDNKLPGEKYSPDAQCQFTAGKQFKAYYDKPENICESLWCLSPNGWKYPVHPALDGSWCGIYKVS
ncbi:A disintegrin and metalloproteinase with thrombospondin motifs 19-like [Centruroides sculpturatus]|uniref:A disintegrin and metalloproteinase with thrombospondin motifs 19-like n=1 Tax=Centruroides sculpturatus TaxID=218467 RepID=UPI000C6DC5E6|nr:A disintegrin and metalloproteinase with thrombospondin motifs 19-like [Centruroides sculpturatus]